MIYEILNLYVLKDFEKILPGNSSKKQICSSCKAQKSKSVAIVILIEYIAFYTY